jgi:ferredoxin
VDEHFAASGAPAPGSAEIELLERCELSSRDDHCNHGCGICETSCPLSVVISEVLRTRR